MPRELSLRDALLEISHRAARRGVRIAAAALLAVACSEETRRLDGADAGGDIDAADVGGRPDAGPPGAGDDAGGGAGNDAGGGAGNDAGGGAGNDAGGGADAGPTDAASPVGSAGCGTAAPAGGSRSLSFDGRSRSYILRIPPRYDPSDPVPLVLAFHGFTSNPQAQEWLSRLTPLAEREGFVVAYPQGVVNSWNGGACCGVASTTDVDDVGFAAALVEHLSSELCIDARRVYAMGFSNGGFLSHRLACERPEVFAAVGSVAGLLTVSPCATPVPVLQIHGTDDNVVPYNGNALLGFPSVRETIEAWRDTNRCGPLQTLFTRDDVRCDGCSGDADVALCTVDAGGHTWPGGRPLPGVGRTSHTISASEEIWQFFVEHPQP
ncbi:MAG: PHB depolymerase family esterase [Myxococcota bacterium]